MARVQNTLIGRSSGSVGGATFTTWKGINVLKSKPISVANPKTLGQRQQRNRFALLVMIYRLIAGAVKIGYADMAIMMSAYNAFMSENVISATTVNLDGSADLVPSSLKVSKGTIGVTPISLVDLIAGSLDVFVAFPVTIPVGGASNDIPYVVAYNETQDIWCYGNTNILRSDAETTASFLTELVSGDNIHTWLFFKSEDDNDTSDSFYSQNLVP